jgi:hypothetical protein
MCKNPTQGKATEFAGPERYYKEISLTVHVSNDVKIFFAKNYCLLPLRLLKIAEENMQKTTTS